MDVKQLISRWEQVRANLLTTIEKLSQYELDYAPFEGAYSVAQLILHIAHEEEGEIHFGITHELAAWPPEFSRDKYPSLNSMVTLLTEVHSRTDAYLRTLDDSDLDREITTPWGLRYKLADILWHVLEHEIHHRG